MDKTTGILFGILGLGGAVQAYKWHENKKKNKTMGDPPEEFHVNIKEMMIQYSNQFHEAKVIQKIIPRFFENQSQLQNLTSNLYYRKTTSHLASLTKSLSQPIYDLLDRGGKRWRPFLCMLIAEMYGHKKEEIYDIAALCEIVHNGTLIVDDIEDSSTVRRDKECVHLLYGVDISINAGNFMYFAPYHYLLKHGNFSVEQKVKIGAVFAQEMTSLHIGQGWDILWHNVEKLQGNFPTEDHYLQMTAHKTGVLARLSAKLTCAYLNLSEKETQILGRFAQTMGVAFQIQDDLLNLQGEEYVKTKGYSGQDIHEGKITIMVLHFLNSQAPQQKKDRLIDILKKKTENQEEINEAISMMKEAGSLENARKRMFELIERSWSEVEEYLPKNIYSKYLKQLAEFGVKRNK